MGSKQEIIEYKNAVRAAFSEKYPDVCLTVFNRIDDNFKTPAIVVNPPLMTPSALPPVKDRLNLTLKVSTFVCYLADDIENEFNCIQLSANLAKFISMQTWGLKITPAKISSITPVVIEGLEDLIIQRIDFEQQINITEDS